MIRIGKCLAAIALLALICGTALALTWHDDDEEFLLLLKTTPSADGDALLLEIADYMLLESEDKILKE